MIPTKKVIWAEGVLLGQQHFQQWDRYWKEQQHLILQNIAPLAWGVHTLNIDETALINGKFRIRKCCVIYPDGEMVIYNAEQNNELICSLSAKNGEIIEIYLGLPMNQQISDVTGYAETGQLTRWKADYRQVADNFDLDRQREILLGRDNLLLLRGDQNHEVLNTIKIAEVIHEGQNSYRLTQEFIPSVTQIRASDYLTSLLSRYIELIKAKLRIFAEYQQKLSSSAMALNTSDQQNLLLLQTFNRILPYLMHWQQYPHCHPQQLFLSLIDLSYSLISLVDSQNLPELPSYQHNNLTLTFSQLNQFLLYLFDLIIPVKKTAIKLLRDGAFYWTDKLDNSLLTETQFFIMVYFQSDDVDWTAQFARQIKVGAASSIANIVTSALPGVRVTHRQRFSHKLPMKIGYEYFALESQGEFWQQIKIESALAIFIPQIFAHIEIDLISIPE